MTGFFGAGISRGFHGPRCLSYLCSCVVSEDCGVCRPAATGPLCETHRNAANHFARSMEAVGTPTKDDEHAEFLGSC